jgi:hypothetical protein
MTTQFKIPPSAVRIWRGFKQDSLTQDEFFQRLGQTFIPSTVQMQIKNGLDTYIPAIPCGMKGKPATVPDETAILFWDSQETYEAGFDTLAGRTYTLTHGGCYTKESGADFPTLYSGEIKLNSCYYLIDESADWMHGKVKHLVADADSSNIAKYQTIVSDIQSRGDVDGAILCIGDDYIVYWQLNGESDPGYDELAALSSWKTEIAPKDYSFPNGSALWDKWPGMDVKPGDSFNMQFVRQFEMEMPIPPQPVAPDSVHVWRGYKKGTDEDFADFLGHVFLPAGSLLQPNAGLHAFFPSLPSNDGKPDTVPDQTALMFWTNQETYKEGFNKMAVRAYTNLHGDLYDTTKSKSGFPVLLEDKIDQDQPYFLIDQKADWMISDVHHLVAQKSPDQAPSDFIEMILNWAKSIQTNKPEGLNGAILCADDDYTVIWLCWEAGADQTKLIEELASETKVWLNMESSKYKMPVGLWDNWTKDGKPDGIPQVFPSSLSIQLDRPTSQS